MSITLRIILLCGSFISFIFCIKKIKQAKLKVDYSILWMFVNFVLILMAIFSDFIGCISSKLGFLSPVNFVFFILIVFLFAQAFLDNLRISELNEKIKNLSHYIALKEKEKEKHE